jgi:prepilin-type N-terminal cleavage/methylation domain-containing protein
MPLKPTLIKIQGFSLIEVIITMIILGIILLAINKMTFLKEVQLQKNNQQYQSLMKVKNMIARSDKNALLNCRYCGTHYLDSISCVDSNPVDNIPCSLGSVHTFTQNKITLKILF